MRAGLLLRNLQGVALDSGTPGPDPSDLTNRFEDPTPKPPTSGKSKAWGRPRRTRPAGEGAADADEEESLGMDSRPTTAGASGELRRWLRDGCLFRRETKSVLSDGVRGMVLLRNVERSRVKTILLSR